ncbi:hypothetical protein HDG34_001576 [Paraburkholderia sp. HC6.4b]|uniref:hypothetical protein n=1 Tax=unclassified Paraburkholderia TaxID=2615204 RepID=UPI00161BFEB7|nr:MULTISPECIES: hypothetical protein [unclassified Paraburkholderia]MBB5407644.1 hypothetical protein [Paraburkholderia sp. HC6.4b]MBB5452343.1 hypothetical protein [Paraburkholderia sp. Kb1A]
MNCVSDAICELAAASQGIFSLAAMALFQRVRRRSHGAIEAHNDEIPADGINPSTESVNVDGFILITTDLAKNDPQPSARHLRSPL